MKILTAPGVAKMGREPGDGVFGLVVQISGRKYSGKVCNIP
jgi:hypothetical protein